MKQDLLKEKKDLIKSINFLFQNPQLSETKAKEAVQKLTEVKELLRNPS